MANDASSSCFRCLQMPRAPFTTAYNSKLVIRESPLQPESLLGFCTEAAVSPSCIPMRSYFGLCFEEAAAAPDLTRGTVDILRPGSDLAVRPAGLAHGVAQALWKPI